MAPTDRELFFASLALFDVDIDDEPMQRQRPLDADADIDGFVDDAFAGGAVRNLTIPPT